MGNKNCCKSWNKEEEFIDTNLISSPSSIILFTKLQSVYRGHLLRIKIGIKKIRNLKEMFSDKYIPGKVIDYNTKPTSNNVKVIELEKTSY